MARRKRSKGKEDSIRTVDDQVIAGASRNRETNPSIELLVGLCSGTWLLPHSHACSARSSSQVRLSRLLRHSVEGHRSRTAQRFHVPTSGRRVPREAIWRCERGRKLVRWAERTICVPKC